MKKHLAVQDSAWCARAPQSASLSQRKDVGLGLAAGAVLGSLWLFSAVCGCGSTDDGAQGNNEGSAAGNDEAGGRTGSSGTATTSGTTHDGGKGGSGNTSASGGSTETADSGNGGAAGRDSEGEEVRGCGTSVEIDPTPFGCEFAWGANGNNGNRASYLDFITTWVGYEWSQDREGDCDGCGLVSQLRSSDAIAIYYAYFAGYALPDCNERPQGPNLCTDGARWLKQNRDRYLNLYSDYARMTYQASPDKGVLWLLEGDFVQYTYEDQNDPFSVQELGELARDVVCAIKSNAPNAIVAINHSSWISNELTDEFWSAMPMDIVDLVWTTGVGDNDGFINGDTRPDSYNARTATYEYLSNLTQKPIWVDTSFGLSQQADSWTSIGSDELNRRIADGVIAANVTEPPSDYENRIRNLREQLDPVCQ